MDNRFYKLELNKFLDNDCGSFKITEITNNERDQAMIYVREWDWEADAPVGKAEPMTEVDIQRCLRFMNGGHNLIPMRDWELEPYWYAVQLDEDDSDWSYGSHDLEAARKMARKSGAYRIAVINERYKFCEDEIILGGEADE